MKLNVQKINFSVSQIKQIPNFSDYRELTQVMYSKKQFIRNCKVLGFVNLPLLNEYHSYVILKVETEFQDVLFKIPIPYNELMGNLNTLVHKEGDSLYVGDELILTDTMEVIKEYRKIMIDIIRYARKEQLYF